MPELELEPEPELPDPEVPEPELPPVAPVLLDPPLLPLPMLPEALPLEPAEPVELVESVEPLLVVSEALPVVLDGEVLLASELPRVESRPQPAKVRATAARAVAPANLSFLMFMIIFPSQG